VETIVFTVIGIAAYVIADRILNWMEVRRGARFEYRTLIFFALLLALALGAFQLVNLLLTPRAP